jgi:hypothetical protein
MLGVMTLVGLNASQEISSAGIDVSPHLRIAEMARKG